ncbi:MAG: recombination mediator RecR [Christensenellales bacterium]
MGAKLAAPIAKLANELSRLKGIGPKTAQRLAYTIVGMPSEQAMALSGAIREVKETIHPCIICGNYTQEEQCDICSDARRDRKTICLVREARDVVAMERAGNYAGVYHVLGGVISPMDDVGPDDINIEGLIKRAECGSVQEVIIATSSDVEGEATASYIAKLLKEKGIRVTRIARGIPVGADLEYTDEVTLSNALSGRREL